MPHDIWTENLRRQGKADPSPLPKIQAASKPFFSGLDLGTAKYVEELLGQNTEYDTTFGGIDAAARTVGVPLMKADEIRMLPLEKAILVSGRQHPALLKMLPLFRVKEWRLIAESSRH